MNGHDREHHYHAQDARQAHLHPQEVEGDQRHGRGEPEVVQEHGGDVEAVHVVGEEIHHLPRGGLAQRVTG